MTKAEDKNLSVACASIISRYVFLNEKKKLEEKAEQTIKNEESIDNQGGSK